MNLNTTIENNINIVTVCDPRIDAAAAIQFKDAMLAATEDGPTRVVLDMSRVKFVDSSGLGAIVAAMKQLGDGRQLDLAGMTPDVDKVFRLTRMDTVFDIYDTLASATGARAAG